ncbi:MAG: tRNA (adenosine(37)-N6)-dimethylallyltransferase MiaA [Christensenellales bacterium]
MLVIAGPTASGKSGVAVELCRILDGEVVSCDSMQIYKKMDIGTAKIRSEEMCGIPHHMLSVLEPFEENSAAIYAEMAIPVIEGIFARNKQPVLCGGTGLYIDSLTKPMGFSVRSDENVRAKWREYLALHGKTALHDRLREIDPQSASRLHENDVRRVIRALEVFDLTETTLTQHSAMDAEKPPLYSAKLFALDWGRETLYERCDRRVFDMLSQGLIDEVRSLLSDPRVHSALSMQAIGYKEIQRYIAGECTLEQAISDVQRATRSYAKRQETWFRRDSRVTWLDPKGKTPKQIAEEIARRRNA